jgi:hypothetical protein
VIIVVGFQPWFRWSLLETFRMKSIGVCSPGRLAGWQIGRLADWQIGTGQNIIVIKGAKSAIAMPPMGHESIIIRYFDTPKPHFRSPLAILQAEASNRHIAMS